jgi:hypothetical protein
VIEVDNPLKSSELCGFLPFLVHNVPGVGMKMFAPVWRHLLLMKTTLIVLTSPAAPSSIELSQQLDEAKAGWDRGPREIWATIPYNEITRVRLRGGRRKAVIPRLVIQSHHWQVPRMEVDYWNNLTLVFGVVGGGRAFDPRKISEARELLPRILPSRIRLKGF